MCLAKRHNIEIWMIEVAPHDPKEREVLLHFRVTQKEIIREAVGHAVKPKQAVLHGKLALLRVCGVAHRHAGESAKAGITEKHIKEEGHCDRNKKRGKVVHGIPAE